MGGVQGGEEGHAPRAPGTTPFPTTTGGTNPVHSALALEFTDIVPEALHIHGLEDRLVMVTTRKHHTLSQSHAYNSWITPRKHSNIS